MAKITFTRALVTGASSGIGEEMARQLAAAGADLVLVARSTDRLTELADELEVDVEVLTADLTDAAQVAVVAERIGTDPQVDLVINNAGFGSGGRFHELPLEGELAQVTIHISAVVTLSHAALRAMVPRGHGGLMNVSSVASFQPIPHGATYAACKAFETSFTEALHIEADGTGVHVTALCPGFVDTPLLDSEGIDVPSALRMTVEHVARSGLDAIANNEAVRVPGLAYKAAAALSDSMPRPVMRALMRLRSPFG